MIGDHKIRPALGGGENDAPAPEDCLFTDACASLVRAVHPGNPTPPRLRRGSRVFQPMPYRRVWPRALENGNLGLHTALQYAGITSALRTHARTQTPPRPSPLRTNSQNQGNG